MRTLTVAVTIAALLFVAWMTSLSFRPRSLYAEPAAKAAIARAIG
jgi:hypothetical protein